MKFFLTIYICSAITQHCAEVPMDKYSYDRFYNSHYMCIKKGLGESYGILYDGKIFQADQIESIELYPKFVCEKVKDSKSPGEPA
jgi:hypothetical protein